LAALELKAVEDVQLEHTKIDDDDKMPAFTKNIKKGVA